jgi:hypothetical protein
LIASGARVAFGAPCFFGTGDAGAAVGEDCGVAVGEGAGLGVSVGSGVGKDFFFRFGDPLGAGEAEGLFFLIDGVTDGAADSSFAGEGFFFGEAVGEGDGLFVVAELFFFFRGFGVGVGVEKIFLIVSASDRSAARLGATVETARMRINRTRTIIVNGWTD